MNINLIECIPASGKTKAILSHIKETKEKAVVASISMLLSKQSYDYFNSIGGKRSAIVDSDHRAKKNNNESIKHIINDADVIFITHQALMNIEDFEMYRDYNLYIDEVPELVSFDNFKFNSNIKHIKEYCEPFYLRNGEITDLVLKESKRDELEEVAKDGLYKNDDIAISLFPLYKSLLKSIPTKIQALETGYQCFFINDSDISQWLFKSVTIASSNIKDTLTGKLLETYNNVKFVESPLQQKVDFKFYKNTERVNIHIMYDGDWSRYSGDKQVQGKSVYNAIKGVIEDTLHKQSYLYCTNTYRSKFSTGLEIPYNPHGLNMYSNYTNVVAMFSYNPQPWLVQLLKDLALNANKPEYEFVDAFMISKYFEPAFQLCARCDIRHYKSNKKINLFVADYRLANYMKNRYFPDANIITSHIIETKPKSFQSTYEMKGNELNAFKKFKSRNKLDVNVELHHQIVKDWLIKYRLKRA